MKIRGHDLGVCSWSLHPNGTADLVKKLRMLGLEHVHLALGPLLAMDESARRDELNLLKAAGIQITATMISFRGEDYSSLTTIHKTGGIVPNSLWEERRKIALAAGALTVELGVSGLSLHAGFVPQSNDPLYGTVLARVCELAGPMASAGVDLLLETGQETPNDLLQFLNDLRCQNVGVNYDPANLILYGEGDPIESVSILERHIKHVHLKDGVLSDAPGTKWGKEVALGSGQVPVPQLIDALDEVQYTGPLIIENEFDPELDGIREAITLLQGL